MKQLNSHQFRDRFNQASDCVRLLTIFSPTCLLCQYGQGDWFLRVLGRRRFNVLFHALAIAHFPQQAGRLDRVSVPHAFGAELHCPVVHACARHRAGEALHYLTSMS